MSLSSSLYSGVSGLSTLGNSMQIIGDNIANVNTVGFKQGSYVFQDLLSQITATQSGTAQVGRGTSLGDVFTGYVQGSFETTGNTTDLAIGGDGFFIVSEKDVDTNYYTRAGNFRFDKDGYLTNPEGKIVQGWELDTDGDNVGSVKNVQMESYTSPPEATDHLTVITNLDSRSTSESAILQNAWSADTDPNISTSKYEYQSTVKAYDALGNTHDVTMYYDKLTDDKNVWEYMIACNPTEDKRNLLIGTESRGMMARGMINFNDASGKIESLTMYRMSGLATLVQVSGTNNDEDVIITAENSEAITKDGHDFRLEFDGTSWAWSTETGYSLPENYAITTSTPAVILDDSTSTEVRIDLNDDNEVDLKIQLAKVPQATDSLKFDLNDPDGLHIQNVINTTYSGDTGNDNTSMTINDYQVMTENQEDIQLNWDSYEDVWYWSNPTQQNVTDTTTSTGFGVLDPFSATEEAEVASPELMTEYLDDFRVDYFQHEGVEDLTFSNDGEINGPNIVMTQDRTNMTVDTPAGNQYELIYDQAGDTWSWDVTGTNIDPVAQYPNIAAITWTNTSGAQQIVIDLDTTDATTNDIIFDFANDLTTSANGGTISFTVDADQGWAFNHPDVVNETFLGGTAGNTKLTVNNSSALSPDFRDMRLDYSNKGSTNYGWYWNDPVQQTASNENTNSLNGIAGASAPTIVRADMMREFSQNIRVAYNAGDVEPGPVPPQHSGWDWAIAGRPSGSPPAEYPDAVINHALSNDTTLVIDIDSTDGIADNISYTFSGGGGAVTGGYFQFDVDPLVSTPPAAYTNAEIKTGTSKKLEVDLDTTDGLARTDLTWDFTSSLKSKSSIEFDIETEATTPPREYPDATIVTTVTAGTPTASSSAGLFIDMNNDGTTNIGWKFIPPAPVVDGYITFDIDPRVPPEKYPDAIIETASDGENLYINLDDSAAEDSYDITFSFTSELGADSTIKFDIEGTTAWKELEQEDINTNGFLEFEADFLGAETTVVDNKLQNTRQQIEFDIGSVWNGTDAWVNDSLSSTQYARSSSTTYQEADGYSAGDLQSVSVATDGVITGAYTNGQLIPIYRVALAKFLNNQALFKEGGNLFSETNDSGTAITNTPGTNGLGKIAPNSLEMSNVDVANEFVKMITSQRGYQANSKVITTVDAMLGEVIAMKR